MMMMKYRPLIRRHRHRHRHRHRRRRRRRRRRTYLQIHLLHLRMGRRGSEGDSVIRELLITKKKKIISFDFRPCCDIGEQSLLP